MQWWCAAIGIPWTWTWRPYPGVWLFILAIAAVHVVIMRRVRARGHEVSRGRAASFWTGLLLLWIALDWPVGALGAGYLASLHMLQFILIGIAAPPLLLHGWPSPGTMTRSRTGWTHGVWRGLTHPLSALGLFTVTVIATHLPRITDLLMPRQLGSFAIDVLWLGTGLLYWWPLMKESRPWFTAPVKIVYLFANMVFMTAPGAMITFSDLPIYATYELAPPIPGFSPIEDQRLAGVGMRFGASAVVFAAISLLFLRWNRAEVKLMKEEQAAEQTAGDASVQARG
jgi:putative membrane protein